MGCFTLNPLNSLSHKVYSDPTYFARIYLPPTAKPNTPSEYNPTGVQANFVQLNDKGQIISNGHLVIE